MKEKTTLSVSSYRCIVSLPEKRCIIIGMEKKHYTPEQRTTLFVSVVTAFITTFMGSALNLSVPDIEKDFGVSAAEVGWVVTIYMLTCAAAGRSFWQACRHVSEEADTVDRDTDLRPFIGCSSHFA